MLILYKLFINYLFQFCFIQICPFKSSFIIHASSDFTYRQIFILFNAGIFPYIFYFRLNNSIFRELILYFRELRFLKSMHFFNLWTPQERFLLTSLIIYICLFWIWYFAAVPTFLSFFWIFLFLSFLIVFFNKHLQEFRHLFLLSTFFDWLHCNGPFTWLEWRWRWLVFF